MRYDGKFIEAYFMNESKDFIETVFKHNDGTLENILVEVNLNDELYKKLIDTFSIDKISDATDKRLAEQLDAFKSWVKHIAERDGLIYDPNGKDNKIKVDDLFVEPTDDVSTDILFNVKMKCFELPQVVDSTNNELKQQLRKSKTVMEAFYITGKFLYE